MTDYGIPSRLTTGVGIAASGPQPTIRIRVEHSHTLAAGWRLSSSTAELTLPLNSLADAEGARDLLTGLQRLAFETGQEEAVRRNEVAS